MDVKIPNLPQKDGRTVVYVINVDWFFVSHFLHLAQSAKREGWNVIVATHAGAESETLRNEGIEVVALPTSRSQARRFRLRPTIDVLANKLTQLDDPVLHGFGHYGIVTGTLAARRAGIRHRVFSVTGRGYSATSNIIHVRALRHALRAFCRRVADGPDVWWTAENRKDVSASGLARPREDNRVRLLGGAGIDTDIYRLTPMPERAPLKMGLVSRLVWSKGIDVAVAAVQKARRQGCNVTLSIAGALDPGNPRALSEADMARFAATDGVTWIGKTDDIPAFWRDHHVAILASRGGEGVPRSLIEAASCGRPVLTSDVWGCGEFAVATKGWIAPRDDVAAFTRHIIEIAKRDDLVDLGRRARDVVVQNYTEDAVWSVVRDLYRRLPSEPSKPAIDVGHATTN